MSERLINKGLLIVIAFSLFCNSCNILSNDRKNSPRKSQQSNFDSLKRNADSSGDYLNSAYHSKVFDSLTLEETSFIKKIQAENEFILFSNQVERWLFDSNFSPVATKLLISKDTLEKRGYFSFEFIFYGKITDVNIKYSYNLGQAAFGYGSVMGNATDDYIHFLNSCGTTSCIIQAYKNGDKIFEKIE